MPRRRAGPPPGRPPARRSARDERLSLRATAEQAATIRAAAEAEGVSVTDFVLDNAMVEARRVLADRVHFVLSPEEFDRFVEILDRPPRDLPRLREFLARPSVWQA